jgi:RNA polymerase sigma-70 factor (ECF subfamily)
VNELVAAAPAAASAPRRPAPLAERLGEEAFGRFHAAVAPRLWAYVRSHLPNRAEADDLAQEAFTRVLASSFTPESEEHLIRYLYRTAANLLHDRGRSAARGTTVPLEEAERADRPEPAETPRPALRLDLERALRALRSKDRELLWLAHVEGIEHQRIAEIVGVTPGSVRVMLFRARQRLARLMHAGSPGREDRHVD